MLLKLCTLLNFTTIWSLQQKIELIMENKLSHSL